MTRSFRRFIPVITQQLFSHVAAFDNVGGNLVTQARSCPRLRYSSCEHSFPLQHGRILFLSEFVRRAQTPNSRSSFHVFHKAA